MWRTVRPLPSGASRARHLGFDCQPRSLPAPASARPAVPDPVILRLDPFGTLTTYRQSRRHRLRREGTGDDPRRLGGRVSEESDHVQAPIDSVGVFHANAWPHMFAW